ncbi:MAG: flippase-like domain-containing protein [Succinivibrio sp.]|nr:flippase-like domain-containing protein [Succinivibrio sp.]
MSQNTSSERLKLPRLLTPGALLKLALGLGISALFVFLLLRQLDFAELIKHLREAAMWPLLLGTSVFLAGYTLRVYRWQLILRQYNPDVTLAGCTGPFYATIAANNVLPLRLGDVLRLFAFNSRLGINVRWSLASVIAERGHDLLILFLFVPLIYMLSQRSINDKSETQAYLFTLLPLIAAALTAAVLLFPRLFKSLLKWLLGIAGTHLPRKLQEGADFIFAVLDILQSLAVPRIFSRLVAVSFLGWCCEAGAFVGAALSLNTNYPTQGALLGFPLGTLAAVIPSAPGFIGTFDYFTCLGLQLTGWSREAALSCAFLSHLIIIVPVTLIGGLYLMLRPPMLTRTASDHRDSTFAVRF